ncbi:hypothetical protein F959_01645 [Acinetobacter venetianus RAG-1 = CIP 110063]|uniref:Uncharacterized protein n=1 Tax=Acinetobacter venetianus (strain ATCC 31012 / DSM 23050 / BCRC 14357 / CCUG 45561 / CIP 110063 / KCTC 2702 / LMG 19082 / RAG-1) TaxID=1191460 RepID=N8ZYG2_ACIVR|nr:hypothetical protein [Acinetobacter venetianus]ENV36838.1 hypothetical protein F959_01645 [Acinetobacter venetianus RAG-1 = CIP 110063]
MNEILNFLADHTEIISVLMSMIMFFMTLSSLHISRRMYRVRRKAERKYIEALLRNDDFRKIMQNPEKMNKLLALYSSSQREMLDDNKLFIRVFKELDILNQEQIKPALFQIDLESRHAYMKKVVDEAVSAFSKQHC